MFFCNDLKYIYIYITNHQLRHKDNTCAFFVCFCFVFSFPPYSHWSNTPAVLRGALFLFFLSFFSFFFFAGALVRTCYTSHLSNMPTMMMMDVVDGGTLTNIVRERLLRTHFFYSMK